MAVEPGDPLPAECTPVGNFPFSLLKDDDGIVLDPGDPDVAGRPALASDKTLVLDEFDERGIGVCDDDDGAPPFMQAGYPLQLFVKQARKAACVTINTSPISPFRFPRMAGYHDGTFYVLFIENLAISTDDGDTWSFSAHPLGGSPNARNSVGAVDSQGRVHVAFIGGDFSGPFNPVKYTVLSGGSWSAPAAIGQTNQGAALDKFGIAVDSSDNPHIVWDQGDRITRFPEGDLLVVDSTRSCDVGTAPDGTVGWAWSSEGAGFSYNKTDFQDADLGTVNIGGLSNNPVRVDYSPTSVPAVLAFLNADATPKVFFPAGGTPIPVAFIIAYDFAFDEDGFLWLFGNLGGNVIVRKYNIDGTLMSSETMRAGTTASRIDAAGGVGNRLDGYMAAFSGSTANEAYACWDFTP
jgi:hypothetical protein